MTFVRTCGEFLSRLNHAGKLGKVIKTMPDFEPGTDPEIVKLNFAISTAKKIGTCIISRMSKEYNYTVGIGDQTLLSTFLNNEYIGIISKGNEIMEYKNLGIRDYTYGNDIDILACFLDGIENYTEEKKVFNNAVKSAHKYQVVIKEDGKYKSEYKGSDDNLINKIINSGYLGIFTKSGTYAEFKNVDIRRITTKTPPPKMFSEVGDLVDTSFKITPPPIPVIPPKKVESLEEKILNKFNSCVKRTSDFNFIKFKNGDFIDVFGYIQSLNLVDNIIDGNYVAFRSSNNKLVEYYSLGTTDLIDGMKQNDRLAEFGFSDDTEGFIKSVNYAIEANGWFIYRWKVSKFSSNYYDNGSKPQTILRGVDYFAHISSLGKITEFVKIGERDIFDMMSLPILPNKKSSNEIEDITKKFQELSNNNSFRVIRFKDGKFELDGDVMWNYRVQGSSYFSFKVGKTIIEYSLLEVRDIFSEIAPNSRLQNYDIPTEYLFSFRNELKDERAKFITRTKNTAYVGQNHMNVRDYGVADYIGIIDNDRKKLYEYVKIGVREITPDMELPNVL